MFSFYILLVHFKSDVPQEAPVDQEEADLQRALALRFDSYNKSLRSIHLILPSVETAELERIQREGNSSGKNAICYSVIKWDIFLLLVKQIRHVWMYTYDVNVTITVTELPSTKLNCDDQLRMTQWYLVTPVVITI